MGRGGGLRNKWEATYCPLIYLLHFFIIFSKVLSDFIIDIPENQIDISLGCCQNRIKMTKMISGLEFVLESHLMFLKFKKKFFFFSFY